MSMPVGIDLAEGPEALGVLALRGADAVRFLQGQVSADVEKLTPGSSTFAGLHNPQGRVVALLAVVRTSPEEILATLPRELVDAVAVRLRKYVLRSKLRIDDESAALRVLGVWGGHEERAFPTIAWGDRCVQLLPVEREFRRAPGVTRAQWDAADVRAGIPQVFAPTSESFIAQMLNLDLLGAIAFDKGCYTGQEVIARAHYRGRVKRRMQRWHNGSGVGLKPGDPAHAGDGRALTVVRVGVRDSQGEEVLAVGNFAPGEMPTAVQGTEAADGPRVTGPLPLPYALPE